MQVDDAGMVEFLEHNYFSLACFLLHRVLKFRLFVNFDGVLVLVPIVHAQTHLSIGPLPDRLANLIIVKGIFFGLGFWFAVEVNLLSGCGWTGVVTILDGKSFAVLITANAI